MKKVTVYVTETIRHKASMELEDDIAGALAEELSGVDGDNYAEDLTSGYDTRVGGCSIYVLDWYNVSDVE